MAADGPILLIENDPDERILIQEILKKIKVSNELQFFNDGADALKYLEMTTDKPFLILSNVHLQKIDGIELRQKIEENPKLREKAIPFVFLTTDVRRPTIDEAYQFMVQGYFEKNNTIDELARTLKVMVDYWSLCKHPNAERA